MAISRRSLFGGSLVSTSTAIFADHISPNHSAPPEAIVALNRIAYGPTLSERAYINSVGFTTYIQEQLNPVDSQDTLCNDRLATATLRINYAAGSNYPAVDEMRPLETLDQGLEDLWQRSKHEAFAERMRPVDEVRAATWIRAVYSKWQLRELMMEFWINHFNVHARSDSRIAATWPLFVYQVIRTNCFGNFRNLLEAVAQSIAMQYYLDNATSRDGPANENYARELFELHTLGADHYLNNLYDDWQLVPGATTGNPIGYIDADVYEAARAFTGWTIADGRSLGGGIFLPNTGAFIYVEQWHDSAQKRVLAQEFLHNTPPLEDGRRVFDLLASHPGTARYMCTKLCQRFIADQPPAELINQATDTWLSHINSVDQIKRTLETILLSPYFTANWGSKVKRPFEVFVSFLRATHADVVPDSSLFNRLSQSGYLMFDWPTPTGLPDTKDFWLSTNGMLQRWNTLYTFRSDTFVSTTFDFASQMPPEVLTSRQIVDFWIDRLLGYSVDVVTHSELLTFMSQSEPYDQPPVGSDNDLADRLTNLVILIGMLPQFQER